MDMDTHIAQGKHNDLISDRKQGSVNKTKAVAMVSTALVQVKHIQITLNVGAFICTYWFVCSLFFFATKMAKHSTLLVIIWENLVRIWFHIDILLKLYYMHQIQPSKLVFLCLSSFPTVELERGQVIYVIFVLLTFLCAWSICWDVPCCGRAISDKGKTVYLVQDTCSMSPSLCTPSCSFCFSSSSKPCHI